MIKIAVGVCETCKHYCCDTYDPSPPGVALGAGWIIDCGCEKEDEVFIKTEDWDNSDNIGQDEYNQCPLWEPAFEFCNIHKLWFLGECEKCIDEMEKDIEYIFNIYKIGGDISD